MKTFLLIYFGIGLICAIVNAYSYWNANAYTTGDKVKSALVALFFWWAILLCLFGFWLSECYVKWKQTSLKNDKI
jgi:hypothetical protein